MRLDVFNVNERLFSRSFDAESISIGSGPDAMMRVVGSGMSDMHAVITIGADRTARLIALGSSCQVNGAPVRSAVLRSGDVLTLGGIALAFSSTLDDVRTEPRSVAPRQPIEAVSDTEGDDALAMLMRWGSARGDAGIDRSRGKVLEVAEVWGDTIVDIKHYPAGACPVTTGAAVGHRWRILGRPVAWVPPHFAKLAWALAPTLSEAAEECRSDFYAPPEGLPHDNFALFVWEGDEWVCRFSSKWQGFVDVGEKRWTLTELIASGKATAIGGEIYRIPVPEDAQILMDTGDVIFFSQLTWPGRRVVARRSDSVDYPFLGVMAFMGFLFATVSTLVYSAPVPSDADIIAIPDRFASVILTAPEPEPELPPTAHAQDEPDPLDEGAAAKGAEGKIGKRDSKMEVAKGSKSEMQKQTANREIAENAGVLGVMADDNAMAGVFGTTALNSDLIGGIGALIGAAGDQRGTHGLGSRGSSFGGGGTTDSLGGLGTRGRGGGDADYGQGPSAGPRPEGDIVGIGGEPIIIGALDSALIDGVIKRHMNQFRYCYQRELNKDSSLSGKITVKFVIAGDGSVSRAIIKRSSMDSSAVEGCLTGRFMKLQFPEPKGNGIVVVSYPFMFTGS
ncbi:MAG: AgmX/PglI C-terminal domain-containing protein [Myxococcota bacterium]|nr:AgmX/PglI C-terminal domain-containing protein [Myxococcota bacterium]